VTHTKDQDGLVKRAVSENRDRAVLALVSPRAWESWLTKHHANSSGVWLKIVKKNSKMKGPSYEEALDAALSRGVTTELLEVRLLVEVAMAGFAAERATPEDLESIEATPPAQAVTFGVRCRKIGWPTGKFRGNCRFEPISTDVSCAA